MCGTRQRNVAVRGMQTKYAYKINTGKAAAKIANVCLQNVVSFCVRYAMRALRYARTTPATAMVKRSCRTQTYKSVAVFSPHAQRCNGARARCMPLRVRVAIRRNVQRQRAPQCVRARAARHRKALSIARVQHHGIRQWRAAPAASVANKIAQTGITTPKKREEGGR